MKKLHLQMLSTLFFVLLIGSIFYFRDGQVIKASEESQITAIVQTISRYHIRPRFTIIKTSADYPSKVEFITTDKGWFETNSYFYDDLLASAGGDLKGKTITLNIYTITLNRGEKKTLIKSLVYDGKTFPIYKRATMPSEQYIHMRKKEDLLKEPIIIGHNYNVYEHFSILRDNSISMGRQRSSYSWIKDE